MNSNWSYSPETATLGVDLCDLDLWPLTLTFCMDITFDHGNNSWKFHDDTMMGTWWKRCDRQTDRQTDGRTDARTENTICRAAWSQLKTKKTRKELPITGPLWGGSSSYQNLPVPHKSPVMQIFHVSVVSLWLVNFFLTNLQSISMAWYHHVKLSDSLH